MSTVKIATCMPEQRYDRQLKMEWLAKAVYETDCDLFLTPQEYLGGLYIMPNDMHIEAAWLLDWAGSLAYRAGKAIGIGAAVKYPFGNHREEYWYFGKDGECAGSHTKMGLPSYDDASKGGAGQMYAEDTLERRLRPVELLGLRIGTVFCWEVFSLGLFAGYARQDVTLVVHPIKFAPAAWPILSQNKGVHGALRTIERFEQDTTNMLWLDKLFTASRHEVMCPIAVTCNSWALGPKYAALVGVVDSLRLSRGGLIGSYSCEAESETIRVTEMDPEVYQGIFDGKLTDVVRDPETLRHLRHWTMHRKMRRMGL